MKKYDFNTISIKIIEYEKSTFTIILDCIIDGSKLPSVIIFKLKTISQKTFSNNIFVRINVKR